MPGRADLGVHATPVALIIPAYQAGSTLGGVLERARQVVMMLGARCYVVDDGSRDGTGELGRRAGAVVLTHPRNRGKGAALASGIARALADGAALLVTLDADGQHPPEEIPRLLEPLTSGRADLVLGARARTGTMPPQRRFTNWLSATLATRIAGAPVLDAQTGFRAFTRALATAIGPSETHYDYETAFLLEALVAGHRVVSVAVPTVYDGAASHFRQLADTWRLARVFARHARAILLGAS
jgi:glycosyltransferase involved in cell wall biosynthesis